MTNFRLFAGKHSFDFCLGEESPPVGLFMVTGRNLYNRKLGANGVGKSTLFDAVCWCLYGKTLRKLKAIDVRTLWVEDAPCIVRLKFQVGDKIIQVRRSWSPNTLEIAWEGTSWNTISQEELDKVIGLTYEEMKFAQLIGQFNLKFFDLQPSQKLELFTDVLDLDVWSLYSTRASGKAQVLFSALSDMKVRASELGGIVDTLKPTLANLKRLSNEFEANREHDLALVQTQKKQVEVALATTTAEEGKNKLVIDLNTRMLAKYKRRTHLLDLRCIEANSAAVAAEVTLKHARRMRDDARTALAVMDGSGKVCPTCGQTTSPQHIRAERARLTVRVSKAVAEVRGAMAAGPQAQSDRAHYNSLFVTAREAIENTQDKLNEALSEGARAEAKIAHLKSESQAISNNLENLLTNSNPFRDELISKKRQLAAALQEQADLKESIESKEKRLRALQFWAQGFRDLRLSVIEQHLTALEVAVNASAEALGLINWKIRFDVEKETRSGGLSRGFHVMIRAPGVEREVPWESWGGGETQRLRVAGAIGMSDLILSQRGLDSRFELWDEPTTHLSVEGVESLLDTLAERAKAEQKAIWLIDHASLPSANFSGMILIERDVDGSRILNADDSN